MGDQPTPSVQTQKTTTSSAPPEFIQPFLKDIVGRMSGYIDRKPTLYPDSFTVNPSQATAQSWAGLENYGRTGLGGGGTMPLNTDLVNKTLRGDFLDLSKGPVDAAIRASIAPALDAFRDSTIPGLRSTFAGAGRAGGGAESDALQKAMLNLDRATQETGSKIGLDYYNAERNRQLQTQGLLPSFQNIELQRLGTLGSAGAMRDAYNQKIRDEAIQRYNYNNEGGDLDFLTGLAQRMQGVWPGGTTTGTGTMSGSPAFNSGASTMGSVLGGLGAVAQFLPFLPGISDERAKDVSHRVGFTDDGMPLYLYAYKGSREPRIGPMAQEVAKVKPEAVARHPSGFLMVDYNKAMPEGGLL